jgi:murein DD-endopeptidase MepM/ murein hydrolase activator NlpD
MNRTLRTIMLVFLAAGTIAGGWYTSTKPPDPRPIAQLLPAPEIAPPLVTETLSIRRGDTFEGVLMRANIEAAARWDIVSSLHGTFDVRKFRAGRELTLLRTIDGDPRGLHYAIDADHNLVVQRSDAGTQATVVAVPSTIRETPVCATLAGSLYVTLQKAGENPELASLMADIFAFDIDFYRDPREGDQFCLLVEKKEYENGQPPQYQRILAARYVNSGTTYDAYLFPDPDGKPIYYSGDGRALQSAFLRSPLPFDARVSSHFSRHRLHPILHRYTTHLGTDYAAPTGTPVRAVAAGRVIFSAQSGGSGNLVTIRHPNGYQTQYLHLSRRLVARGQTVEQGQKIGLVGSTGLATGPHLDLRISKNGNYLNWERLRLPRVASIEGKNRAQFFAAKERFLASLEGRSADDPEKTLAADVSAPPAAAN